MASESASATSRSRKGNGASSSTSHGVELEYPIQFAATDSPIGALSSYTEPTADFLDQSAAECDQIFAYSQTFLGIDVNVQPAAGGPENYPTPLLSGDEMNMKHENHESAASHFPNLSHITELRTKPEGRYELIQLKRDGADFHHLFENSQASWQQKFDLQCYYEFIKAYCQDPLRPFDTDTRDVTRDAFNHCLSDFQRQVNTFIIFVYRDAFAAFGSVGGLNAEAVGRRVIDNILWWVPIKYRQLGYAAPGDLEVVRKHMENALTYAMMYPVTPSVPERLLNNPRA